MSYAEFRAGVLDVDVIEKTLGGRCEQHVAVVLVRADHNGLLAQRFCHTLHNRFQAQVSIGNIDRQYATRFEVAEIQAKAS